MLTDYDEYLLYLRLEKGLSENTIEAYVSDYFKLVDYLSDFHLPVIEAKAEHLRDFLIEISDLGIHPRSQARILSSIKTFYHFLIYKDKIQDDPTQLLAAPKIGRKLPEVLAIAEIDSMIASIDLSTDLGHRNKAILEVLYGSGLRVSELVGLQLSKMYLDECYMLVDGKGNKQRLVPISPESIKQIKIWLACRSGMDIHKSASDLVFVSVRGQALTRDMIFKIVKELASQAGIRKTVSPHTFRHSFATHLLENGANLRAIQQLLGHESITTTEIYTHIDISQMRRTILEFHPLNKIEK